MFALLTETGIGSSLLLAMVTVGIPVALWVDRKRAGK